MTEPNANPSVEAELDRLREELDRARHYVSDLERELRSVTADLELSRTIRDRLSREVDESDTRLSEALLAKKRTEYDRDEALGACTELTKALFAQNIRLHRVRDLHTESPAGFCPSCARLGDVSDVDDGLVAHPCPTLRAIGDLPLTPLPNEG